MKSNLFGHSMRDDRHTVLSKEVNMEIDAFLWDAHHPPKESLPFGYDRKTAAAILIEQYLMQVVEDARNNQQPIHGHTNIHNTIAEVVLTEAGYTKVQTQQEISRIRLNIFSNLIEMPHPYLQLVS